ncbi:MAG: TetR/AcrR family transcriptional regulator [Nocardioides sp.]
MTSRADGRQSRWDRHNSQRRQRIIEAAIEAAEAHEPGTEVNVSEIAESAGMSRTVIYRHFSDRAELDLAVQAAILDGLWELVLPAVSLDGTIPEILERGIGAYVGWAVAHPSLHWLADHDFSESGPLEQGLIRVSTKICTLLNVAFDLLGVELSDSERDAMDPMVFGLLGAVFGAVRRWLFLPGRTLSPEALIVLTARSLWFAIQGHARGIGLELDPDTRVQMILTNDVGNLTA